MPTRLFSVVFDALDYRGLADFWSAVLGWPVATEFLQYDEGVVRPPDGLGVELVFGVTDQPKTVKNRVHLDLAGGSEDERGRFCDRLLDLGASFADIGQGDVPWAVMADPEGNEFCVGAGAGAGAAPDWRSRLAAVCLDAEDAGTMGRFWSAAAGWPVETEADWGVALRGPAGSPALVMGPPVAPKSGKNRVHLDVAPPADGDLDVEVDRLVGLGAERIDIGQRDVPWVVLADPEGNEFCVLTPR